MKIIYIINLLKKNDLNILVNYDNKKIFFILFNILSKLQYIKIKIFNNLIF